LESDLAQKTFIVECPYCKAKVGAIEEGRAVQSGIDDGGAPYADSIIVGKCPGCNCLIAGTSEQIEFQDINAEYDRWSDAVRIYPKPAKSFPNTRMPKALRDSLIEADRAIQANANMAACVMFGRALEALCRDHLQDKATEPSQKKKTIMLGQGIKQLREQNIIDDRLFDWSQQLQAFRNLAAHPDDDFAPSRQDTEDLQAFVSAITEYVYDLTDRYNEFKRRMAEKEKKKPTKT
jgi:Domain of unknown function (DUF4145)